MNGCPVQAPLGRARQQPRTKAGCENSFQRSQLPSAPKQFAEKTLGIALLYRSCHSDAERGGGISGTEKLCVHNVFDNRRRCERTRFPAVRRRNDKTWVFGFSR